MSEPRKPGLHEVVLGAFLEDIGKFMQRAHSGNAALPEEVMNRASIILPSYEGRSSHWHALWTDAFFHELERRGVSLPGGLDLDAIRDVAVFHHRPATPLHWLGAEADRLSAGMDRKPRDEAEEAGDGGGGRGAFRRRALRSIFAGVDLGLEREANVDVASACHRVRELSPDGLRPAAVDGDDQIRAYASAWPAFLEGFVDLCRTCENVDLFHEGLLSLSERFTWAVPSSTIDQPDVPLHDHDKSVAAIAACLYRFHAERGELDDEGAIRDRSRPKFRLLAGDLSGIQASLFRLASQQVKGATRILRARSFLMGATLEGAATLCRRRLGLPPYCELLAAGGRFVLLVPVTDDLEATITEVRAELDRWLVTRHLGDLSINVALGRPLSGHDLMQGRFADVWADGERAISAAKLAPLAGVDTGVIDAVYEDAPDGTCATCGVRPATHDDGEVRRCIACHEAHEVGRRLPHASAVVLGETRLPESVVHRGAAAEVPGGYRLGVLREVPRADDADAWRRIVSGYRLPGGDADRPHAVRHVANYVPRLGADATGARRYRDLDEEARSMGPGDVKTFAHIAADALEEPDGPEGNLLGRPLLAVLKADVDRLGQIFAYGLGQDTSIGRLATLSRSLDAFFTVVLPDLIAREYPNVYTVYAGGDDLLLLGPWYETTRLARALHEAFRAHVCANGHVTLSAGIELCHPHEPLNRAARRAEERLERAKNACASAPEEQGRDRVSMVAAAPLSWTEFTQALEDAERVSAWLRDGQRPLSTAFVYRTLAIARERDGADAALDPGERWRRRANWRGRWAYAVSRTFDRRKDVDCERLRFFDRLLGSGLTSTDAAAGPGAVVALTIALNRNR